MEATLRQGNQVLNLILQKKQPVERLQALLESEYLSDLLGADIQRIDKEKFLEALGLLGGYHYRCGNHSCRSEGWFISKEKRSTCTFCSGPAEYVGPEKAMLLDRHPHRERLRRHPSLRYGPMNVTHGMPGSGD